MVETVVSDSENKDLAGGDPVCWARLVCQECGAVLSEGHNAGCSFGGLNLPGEVLARLTHEPADGKLFGRGRVRPCVST
jgi:hypothetical protein